MRVQNFIVVGVDGSEAATVALRWACSEAIRIGAIIEVVHAFPPATSGLSPVDDADARSSLLLAREVWVALAAITEEPTIRLHSEPGDPAAVLISRSTPAALLVLGAAKRAAADTTSGSIAAICRRNAPCPVAVISAVAQSHGGSDLTQCIPLQPAGSRYRLHSVT
jgi:nucleotide-binding universal stress UspA family protein